MTQSNPENQIAKLAQALDWIAAVLSDCTAYEIPPTMNEVRDMLETARNARKE